MNLIKLLIIIGVVYTLFAFFPNSGDFWRSSFKQEISRNLDYHEPIPDAFKLVIRFEDGDQYTHTHNNGTFRFDILVTEQFNYVTSGQLSQAQYQAECFLNSGNGSISGDLNIQKTITTVGKRSVSDLKKKLRKELIESLTKELLNS